MQDLNCKSVQASLWDEAEAGPAIKNHLRACHDCRLHGEEVRSLRTGFHGLPHKAVSPILATRLRVIASRERSRLILRRDIATRASEIWSRLKLHFDNLWRPLAVPAAGGLLASVFCFGTIVDTLQVRPDFGLDIPVGLFTQVMMDDVSPFSGVGKDVIVQLTVDSSGKVVDFAPQGPMSPDQMHDIGNLVLYSTFKPATSFGQRVSGKVLVGIHHIDVRG